MNSTHFIICEHSGLGEYQRRRCLHQTLLTAPGKKMIVLMCWQKFIKGLKVREVTSQRKIPDEPPTAHRGSPQV